MSKTEINLSELKKDPEFFRDLRIRYFRKALEQLKIAVSSGQSQNWY